MKCCEKGTGKQNHKAECVIGLLKQRWQRLMADLQVPKRLWDYGLIYEAGILSRVARGQKNRTGLERLTENTPDISEWLDFTFFDVVWYHDNSKGDTTDEQSFLNEGSNGESSVAISAERFGQGGRRVGGGVKEVATDDPTFSQEFCLRAFRYAFWK